MSSESESEEFYDAVDLSPPKNSSTDAGDSPYSTSRVTTRKNSPSQKSGDFIFKVPLKLSHHSKLKRHSASQSALASQCDQLSLPDDNCSSLSGSLLGNLKDDDEQTSLPDSKISSARQRRRHHQNSFATTIASPPKHVEDCYGTLTEEGCGEGCNSCMMQPFRVVETDASSVYSSTSLTKQSKATGYSHSSASVCTHSCTGTTESKSSSSSNHTPTRSCTQNDLQVDSPSSPSPIQTITFPQSYSPASKENTNADDFITPSMNAKEAFTREVQDEAKFDTTTDLTQIPDVVASTKVGNRLMCVTSDSRTTEDVTTDGEGPAEEEVIPFKLKEVEGSSSSRSGYTGTPFSSQSLPPCSEPPKAPLSIGKRHKSHPGLLHISLVDPTRGVDEKCDDHSPMFNDEMLHKLIEGLGHSCEPLNPPKEEKEAKDSTDMPPPPVAPPRKKRKKKSTEEDSVSMASSNSLSSKRNSRTESLIPQCSPMTCHSNRRMSEDRQKQMTFSFDDKKLEAMCNDHSNIPNINTTEASPSSGNPSDFPRLDSEIPSEQSGDLSSAMDEESSKVASALSTSRINPLSASLPTSPSHSGVMEDLSTHPLPPLPQRASSLSITKLKPPNINFSKITKRSSEMFRKNKKLSNLSSLLKSHKNSNLSLNLLDDNSDSLSIGKRSLQLKAAIMGKFIVKDSSLKQSPTDSPLKSVTSRKSSQDAMSDQEILEQVSLLNLDTGMRTTLNDAINPLSLQMMRLTGSTDGEEEGSDGNSSVASSCRDSDGDNTSQMSYSLKKRTVRMKKFLEKGVGSAVSKAKSMASRSGEDKDVFADDAPAQNTGTYVKIKAAHRNKGPHEWDELMYVQELTGEHHGPVWCAKFSLCGRLLATAGQDQLLRVWVIKQAYNFFLDIRTRYNPDIKVSPTPSEESISTQGNSPTDPEECDLDPDDDGYSPFMPKPFCVYEGHSADLLDVAWSKNYFILTSSMDKTVRLWHISRKECLCIFQHVDFVTAIAFHPKDDRYFISGSLDGKLRLWSIPEKRVMLWTEVEGTFITAANFCQNGAYTVVGTMDGRCLFYNTNQLKYNTQFNVRSARGKNARGRKITGIEPLPGENKVLVTSNDSRIRLYGLDEHSEHCKYRGLSNISSQIRASFSHDGKFIVAGSENQCIYLWKTHHDYGKFSATARRDRNAFWEGVKAHSAVVTCALFSPHPELVFTFIEEQELLKEGGFSPTLPSAASPSSGDKVKHDSLVNNKGYLLVSADFDGCIKVFLKKEKPKHSSLPASALA